MQVLTAIQSAQMRMGYEFTEDDFLEGKMGVLMKPEDFNFEENVSSLVTVVNGTATDHATLLYNRIFFKTNNLHRFQQNEELLRKHVLPPRHLQETDFPYASGFTVNTAHPKCPRSFNYLFNSSLSFFRLCALTNSSYYFRVNSFRKRNCSSKDRKP